MVFRICRHIKTDGRQCQSPALRNANFCYFHTTLRRRHTPPAAQMDSDTMGPVRDSQGRFAGMEPLAPVSGGIQLGLLEDSLSVQVAISTVINALAQNRLEVRRATALLYGLQLASSNCRGLHEPGSYQHEQMLQSSVTDADNEPIAHAGLNSDQTWDYPDAPNALARKPDAPLARSPQLADHSSTPAETTSAARGDDPLLGGERAITHPQLRVEDMVDDDDEDYEDDRYEDDEEDEEGEDYDTEVEDARWQEAFREFKDTVRRELGPQLEKLAREGAFDEPTCLE